MRVIGVLAPQGGLGAIVEYTVYVNGVPRAPTTSLLMYDVTGLVPSTTYTFAVQGNDAQGNATDLSDSIQVTTLGNTAPVWSTVPLQSLIVGNAYLLQFGTYTADPDSDLLSYSVVSGNAPTGVTFNVNRLQGTPTVAGQNVSITIRASDPFSHTDKVISFVTYAPDVTAPPVPTGVTATPVSSSQINLAWNASVDAAGGASELVSGTQDYRIYRDGSLRTTVTGTSYSDTGLAASTQYSYRVSARDVALNESMQSTASAATTQSTGAPVWTTVPTITFVQGTASNQSIAGYVSDPNNDPLTITKNAVALPTGVTYNQTQQRYEYNGSGTIASTSGHILTADDSNVASIWAALSRSYQTDPAGARAQGITFATDFSNQALDFDQTKHVFGASGVGGQTIAYWKSLVSRYTGDPYFPTCLKIDSPAATGANGASWITSLNEIWTSKTQGFGSADVWIYLRLKIPSSRLIVRQSDGWKFMDVSAYDPANPQASISHTNFEHVGQNVNWHQIFTCYRDDGNGQPDFAFFDASVNDIRIQGIDNGAGVTPNSARYCLYNGGNYTSGCFPFYANEWMHVKQRIRIASYGGSTGNQMDFYVARQGATQWTQVYNPRNYLVGLASDGYTGGTCGLHLNAYETNFVSATVDTSQFWNWLVVGTIDPAPTVPVI